MNPVSHPAHRRGVVSFAFAFVRFLVGSCAAVCVRFRGGGGACARVRSVVGEGACALAVVAAIAAGAVAQNPGLSHGPVRGHTDATSMHVWARAFEPGEFELELHGGSDTVPSATATATATAERDLVLHFVVTGLSPATAYRPLVRRGTSLVAGEPGERWRTGPSDDAPAATIAFGSCADERAHAEQPIWARIVARAPDALVLLGDTPYIDADAPAVRRQRHLEFFASPPVARALRAVPTWCTWDDHDYAVNDAFGAVPAAAHAREVFVAHHAHGSYGDGVRGIYTKWRCGPIETFLLDTRTFADTGPSPLAPGARTLLGDAQLAWLQAGLRASTAPCKVLACGMVWNAGVRPGKRDCWGNWAGERDALFAWLGANDVAGVVLVGGDVHRSRVVVHATAARVGYDLVELVTSPLSQHVVAANDVAVPGLAFDAGEPHSCLLLTAERGGDAPGVRATFLAGDGREFHRRELPFAALRRASPTTIAPPSERGDAAPAYRALVAAMRAAFGERCEGAPERDGETLTAEEAVGPAFRGAVAAAAPAFAAWRAAVAEPACRFRTELRDSLTSEFARDLFLGLYHFGELAVARGRQAIADGDADTPRDTVRALLAAARHFQQQPLGVAWAVAGEWELRAVRLAAALGDDAAARDVLREHLRLRPELAAAAAAVRIEVMQLFDASIAQLQRGTDRRARAARELMADVRRHFLQHIDPYLAAGAKCTEADAAATVAEVKRLGAELGAAARAQLDAAAALEQPGEADATVAAVLGLQLAALLLPSLHGLLGEQAAVLAALRAAAK